MSNTRRATMILMTVLALSAPTHGQRPSYSAPSSPVGGPFSRVPVLNAPFSADASTTFRVTRNDGSVEEHTLTARYYRDALGRVRAELDTAWGKYVVLDLRRGPWRPGMPDLHHTDGRWGPHAFYVLDPAKRTYRGGGDAAAWRLFNGEGRVALPVGRVCFQVAPPVAGTSDAERLAAVKAEVAEDLGVVIASHRSDAIGSVEYELTNIRRDEPPAELFVVPSDYKFVTGSIDDPDPVITVAPWNPGRPCRPISAR